MNPGRKGAVIELGYAESLFAPGGQRGGKGNRNEVEGDRYLDLLGEWDTMLALGLTTWAETPEPSRSDCHAWSASPNYELFRTVLGIDSAAPGFKRVLIRPYLGTLTEASGSIPHPKGKIAVNLKLAGGKLKAEVRLPQGVEGDFIWRGARRSLKAGLNTLSF